MSFYSVIEKYRGFRFQDYFENVTEEMFLRSLRHAEEERCSEIDLLNFLSPQGDRHLEEMAVLSQKLTRRYFGRTVSLYRPIYLANYCSNGCVYCGFSSLNRIKRRQLTFEEIEEEAAEIAKSQVRHILMLTGEAPGKSDFIYLKTAAKILKKYFDSVSIEVYPLSLEQYSELKEIGVDGLTVYQETYDEAIYDKLHLYGPKKDYRFRLDTPERGAKAGLRVIGIGALFGLGDPMSDGFFSGMHAAYLLHHYPDTEVALSIPRIKKAPETFPITDIVSDSDFVKLLVSFRLFLPRVALNVSTRESADFRNRIVELGITKMSGGSKTDVGGYSGDDPSDEQFEISDERSVEEVAAMLKTKGLTPVYKDWWQLV